MYPPQKPVINNHLSGPLSMLFFSSQLMKTPIKKQPTTLVKKVANGKVEAKYLLVKTAVKYLKILPAAPPKPTYKIVFTRSFFGKCRFFKIYFQL